jgi:uncharacterized damage-inducible protein DinB
MPSKFAAKPLELPAIDMLAATPEILRQLMAGVSEENAAKRPDPKRWSIAEVLEHLSHVEGHMFRIRLDRILEEDNPTVESYDQNEFDAQGLYSGRDPEESFAHFEEQRDECINLLQELDEAAGQRIATHPIAGKFTLTEMLNYWAAHDLSHIRQIAELVRTTSYISETGSLQNL